MGKALMRSSRPRPSSVCSPARRALALCSLLCLAAAPAYSAPSPTPAPELRTGAFNPPRAAPEISLVGSDGTPLKLANYRGKVVALGFGYSSCPDVCPTTLFLLAEAKQKLGAAGKDFQVVYVTVDPERDTPARMKTFLAAYDKSFVGGTGTPQALADVRKAYGIQVTREPSASGNPAVYAVHHSSFVYLIDRQGNIRAMMPFGVTVDDIVHDVKALSAP